MFAIEAFARHGLRVYSSPAQEVLADFGARGITVDQLYVMLGDMEAWGCMAILEDHGKSARWSVIVMSSYLTSAVSAGVVSDGQRKQEKRRSECKLPLGSISSDSLKSESTPSPPVEVHPQWGALPSRPPPMTPSPVDTPTYEAPPNSHAFSHQRSSNSVDARSSYQNTNHPGSLEGIPPRQSVGGSYWSTSGESYNMPGHTHRPHPLSCGHMTDSSYASSVFAYGSSPSNAYTNSSQATPFSSQTTPPSSQTTPSSVSQAPRSIGSENGGTNILHFSYAELSEATGGFTEGMIGIGAFGTVFKATVRGNGPYAIKKLHTVSPQSYQLTPRGKHHQSLSEICGLSSKSFGEAMLSVSMS